ncbi:MAG: ABC transporter ATP-binding protein, partial [Candidatus Altiarchaeota archaeon]
PWRTIEENIKLSLEIKKKTTDANIMKRMLSLVGLEYFRERYPFELSGGMQQRVSLARALIDRPELLLMDEPFGALDEITRNALNLEILRIWEQNPLTIVFVTHSIAEAVFTSNRVVVLTERPGKVKEVIDIDLPTPKSVDVKESPEFQEYIRCIRKVLGR